MRHQFTISSFERWRPSTILRRVSGGTLSRKNDRTSSRNACSSFVNARSIGSSCELLQNLEQTRRAHAAADAHGDHRVFGLAAAALDQSVTGEARAGHAVGMADRDCAAVDVDLVGVDAELVAAIDHLHGEGFVELPQADVVDGEAVALEEARY